MRIPSATYRVRFNPNVRFADAENFVPYLHALGISRLYSSPIDRFAVVHVQRNRIPAPSPLYVPLGAAVKQGAVSRNRTCSVYAISLRRALPRP